MNILVLAYYGYYREFSASFVHAQAKAYAALGHRVRALVPIPAGRADWDGKRFSGPVLRREEEGVEILAFRHVSLSTYGQKGFNQKSLVRSFRKHASALLEGFPPDVLHAHTLGMGASLGAELKARLGVPLVTTAHGGDVFVSYDQGNRVQLRESAQAADHVACVSSLLRRRLEDCGVTVPMSVILNGFRIPNTAPTGSRPPLSMVQAGFLIARKKADVTIRSLAALRERHPEASLEIVGSGAELERFQALCGELGVGDAVRFSGYLPNSETLAHMSRARFFIMPSVNEGFGIVYLEAMASGCITVGTEGEGIADLIASGENGFLVPPDNPEAIVRTVEWCLEHPEKADAVAERGRRAALSLTWEKNAAQYLALFEALRERKPHL